MRIPNRYSGSEKEALERWNKRTTGNKMEVFMYKITATIEKEGGTPITGQDIQNLN